jgi:hypothetical protein
MQGNLGEPPVIIRISRVASLIGFALCALMVHFGVYLFGIGLIYFGWQLLDPNTITIDPDGLGWKTTFRRKHWAWDQVCNIRPLPWGQFGWDVNGKTHSIFGFGWEMSTRKIVELLNGARSRWSSVSAREAVGPSTDQS